MTYLKGTVQSRDVLTQKQCLQAWVSQMLMSYNDDDDLYVICIYVCEYISGTSYKCHWISVL